MTSTTNAFATCSTPSGGLRRTGPTARRDLLPRIARARRRRRMERFGALSFVVVLAATTALVLRERGHDRVIVVNTPTTSAAITTAPPRTTTARHHRRRQAAVTPATPTASVPDSATTPAITDDPAAVSEWRRDEQRNADTVDRQCAAQDRPLDQPGNRPAAGHDAIDGAIDGAGDAQTRPTRRSRPTVSSIDAQR